MNDSPTTDQVFFREFCTFNSVLRSQILGIIRNDDKKNLKWNGRPFWRSINYYYLFWCWSNGSPHTVYFFNENKSTLYLFVWSKNNYCQTQISIQPQHINKKHCLNSLLFFRRLLKSFNFYQIKQYTKIKKHYYFWNEWI